MMFSPATRKRHINAPKDHSRGQPLTDAPATPLTENRRSSSSVLGTTMPNRPNTGTPAPWASRLSVLARKFEIESPLYCGGLKILAINSVSFSSSKKLEAFGRVFGTTSSPSSQASSSTLDLSSTSYGIGCSDLSSESSTYSISGLPLSTFPSS
ncbi:hypothetical protein Syun_009633 [Stephania yunnanensis]|uniref:Uncharacterized protein n=1 Tax=Stephania yunnanensis TaxID=152371 RepID=A0AAP0KGS1_9MAGN